MPGAAGLHLVDGLPLLRPEEQVFEAMMDGWRNQQLARNLALSTIEKRAVRLRAFFAHAGTYPWEWLPQHADEWFGDLRSVRGCAHSTMRSGARATAERPVALASWRGWIYRHSAFRRGRAS
jgi:integrase/recombinase XerC